MKWLAVFGLIFFALLPADLAAASRRGQDLIESGHWVYDALAQIELDAGRWHFVDRTPLSVQTVMGILDDVPYEALSEAGKAQFDRILDFFAEFDFALEAGVFSFGTEPKVNVEGYVKTNESLPWVYGNRDRQRLLDVPMRITLGDYLTVFMGFAVGQRRGYLENEHANYVNHVFVEEAFDPNLTHSTYLSTGYKWANGAGVHFSFGYGKQSYGRASLGSAALSDYLTDVPYLLLRVYSNIAAYSFNVQQINPKTVFYSHSLDLRFFKRVTFGVMEGGAGYDSFDMSFVNPFGIFHAYEMHNYYDWISYVAFKVSAVPVKNLRLYFLYVMNEHQLPTERTSGAGALPEGNALQGGIDFQIPIVSGGSARGQGSGSARGRGAEGVQGSAGGASSAAVGFLKFNVEGYYSTPYFLMKENPNWSLVSAKDGTYEWFGSPLGPDAAAAKFSVEYESVGASGGVQGREGFRAGEGGAGSAGRGGAKWSLGLNYVFAARGEFSRRDIFGSWRRGNFVADTSWVYPTVSAEHAYGREYKSPHGVAEYDNIIYIRASYSPLRYLTLVAQPSYFFAFNAGNVEGGFEQGFEFALSARIDFTRIPKKPVKFDIFLRDKHDKRVSSDENNGGQN